MQDFVLTLILYNRDEQEIKIRYLDDYKGMEGDKRLAIAHYYNVPKDKVKAVRTTLSNNKDQYTYDVKLLSIHGKIVASFSRPLRGFEWDQVDEKNLEQEAA